MGKGKSLALLIADKDWDGAYARLKECPREVKQRSETLFRGTVLEDAISLGAPDDLTMMIFNLYPKAAKLVGGDKDYVPLFEACKVGASEEVVEALLLANPDALRGETRLLFKKCNPKQVVKWSTWDYYRDEKEDVLKMVSKPIFYWKEKQQQRSSRALALEKEETEYEVEAEEEEAEEEEQEGEEEEEDSAPKVMEVLEWLEIPHIEPKLTEEAITTYYDLIDLSPDDLKQLDLKIGERNRLRRWIEEKNEDEEDEENDPEIIAMKHYATLFESIDENGSGDIDLKEFTAALKAVGKYRNDFETTVMFEKADTDGSGSIDLEEFYNLMQLAKREEDERSNILRGMATSTSEATKIGKLAASCRKHGILLQHVFETQESDEAWTNATEAVQFCHLQKNNVGRDPPPFAECEEEDCKTTFEFLNLDNEFTLAVAEKTCDLLLKQQLKKLGGMVQEKDVDTGELVHSAVALFHESCHQYSHKAENRHPPGIKMPMIEQTDLHEFRLCAMQLACLTSIQAYPDIDEEMRRQKQEKLIANMKMAQQVGTMIFTQAMKVMA